MEYTKKTIDALTAAYGSPLFVFDEKGFVENYRQLECSMRSGYERYQIAYSYKTNYTPYICRTAKSLGAYAEVVSGMEYSIAKKLGYEDEKIIFNGPMKGEAGIEAMSRGCIVNADSIDELRAMCAAAQQMSHVPCRIGLRVNLDVGQGFLSRFGIREKDLPDAFRLAEETANLRITGLHVHISRARDLEAWRLRTKKMLSLADRFFPEGPEFIDLGSGMFGSMAPEFAAQFDNVPSYDQYAMVTAELVAKHYQGRPGPILFTEPGTTLVNRYMDCISRVEAIKEIEDRCFAVLDCSMYDLGEVSRLKRLPVRVFGTGSAGKVLRQVAFTGYTCLEQDVFYTGYEGELAKGDSVVFGNVGGYSNVLKPPFIRPGCAIAAAKTDGTFELIKSAETWEDALRTYRF